MWNDRSRNQGKLEVVKQETAKMNIDSFENNELQWTRMGKFISNDNCIYC